MVAVTLLMVIVIGLTTMFLQTQKAFKSGLRQVDVFGGGRAAMEMIALDAEQMSPSCDIWNTNFIMMLSCEYSNSLNTAAPSPTVVFSIDYSKPSKPVTNAVETNYLQNLFLLTHSLNWAGVSYKVLDTNSANWQNVVVGSLYRHVTNGPMDLRGALLYSNFYTAPWADYQRVLDGVVGFKVRLFDTSGYAWDDYLASGSGPILFSTNGMHIFATNDIQLLWESYSGPNCAMRAEFRNDQIPAMLEIELSVLEPQAVEILRSFNPSDANYYARQKAFVEKNSAMVHVFRQQIPIRSVLR